MSTPDDQGLAETRMADGQVIARLRAALAWYTTATKVVSFGMEEEQDIGDLAHETLAATPEGQGITLVAATREVLRAVAAADAAQCAYDDLEVRCVAANNAGDEATWLALRHGANAAYQARNVTLAGSRTGPPIRRGAARGHRTLLTRHSAPSLGAAEVYAGGIIHSTKDSITS